MIGCITVREKLNQAGECVTPFPRQIYKLIHRYRRLCHRADEARGTVMNLNWYHWAGLIFETLNELELLGIDTENDDRLNDPTFKAQEIST